MAPLLISGAMALAKEFLPSLVGKIAGDKSGEVAEKVLGIAGELTGADTSSPDGVEHAMDILATNPELGVQLQTRMAELDNELTQMYLADVQDARTRDIEMRKQGQTNTRADVMVVSAFVGVIVISVFLIMKTDVTQPVMVFLTTIGGMLMKNISTAFDFEFGSSRGSKEKSNNMGDMMKLLRGEKR